MIVRSSTSKTLGCGISIDTLPHIGYIDIMYARTIVKLRKEYHYIYVSDPHVQSEASYLLLKNVYKLRERKEGRTAVPEWRRWLTFRNKYMRRKLKETKGNLTCLYCGAEHLDPNMNNPFRKRSRKAATIDHIIAQANGVKKYDEGNMCVCCNACNNSKKDLGAKEFLRRKGLSPHLIIQEVFLHQAKDSKLDLSNLLWGNILPELCGP